jgi:hypothetical protein
MQLEPRMITPINHKSGPSVKRHYAETEWLKHINYASLPGKYRKLAEYYKATPVPIEFWMPGVREADEKAWETFIETGKRAQLPENWKDCERTIQQWEVRV